MGIEPKEYYNDLGHEEWERSEELFVHSIEHENTYPYLEEHLPEGGHILDAGGSWSGSLSSLYIFHQFFLQN